MIEFEETLRNAAAVLLFVAFLSLFFVYTFWDGMREAKEIENENP